MLNIKTGIIKELLIGDLKQNNMDAREEILYKHTKIKLREWAYTEKIKSAMDEYASPLKERIKELEDENKRKINDWENCIKDIQILQSQLKEADSKAVRFAEWIQATDWIHDEGSKWFAYLDLRDHDKIDRTTTAELFEIFEQENK